MNKFLITWDVLRAGQPRPYADSIYEYKVYSDKSEEDVERFCKTMIKPCSQKANPGDSFSGSSDFPHGMNSYYAFRKLSENTYQYLVCVPYTG